MARTTIDELKKRRRAAMTDGERADIGHAYNATLLALDVGEKVRTPARPPGSASANSPPAWAPAKPP